MIGPLGTWPAWPEFTADTAEEAEDLMQYKNSIIKEYGEEKLRASWLKVCSNLEEVTKEIQEKGNKIIPEISCEDLESLSANQKENLKDIGCFLVRGVVQKEVADKWFSDMKSYIADNKEMIKGAVKSGNQKLYMNIRYVD